MSRVAEIFDQLSRGRFICSNAVQSSQRMLYAYTEEHEERLRETFEEIGYRLETGNNYYYFSRVNEPQQSQERRIAKALRWLDIVAFFGTFRSELCRGARFCPHDILSQLDINLSLKEQLGALQKRDTGTKKPKNHAEQIDAVLRELQSEGFIDLENETTQSWKVLDAWDYMDQMVMAVSIFEDEEEGEESA